MDKLEDDLERAEQLPAFSAWKDGWLLEEAFGRGVGRFVRKVSVSVKSGVLRFVSDTALEITRLGGVTSEDLVEAGVESLTGTDSTTGAFVVLLAKTKVT